jgi:hypothetical protein
MKFSIFDHNYPNRLYLVLMVKVKDQNDDDKLFQDKSQLIVQHYLFDHNQEKHLVHEFVINLYLKKNE